MSSPGAPLVPIPEMLDADSSFDLDPGWLSADPFYLDSLENDPLAFVDADGLPLARELDKAWDRFGSDLPKLAVPTLAVHGTNDPIAPVDAVRAYAEQVDPLQLIEFPRAHHDILNDTVHREVAAAIVDFVEKHVGPIGSVASAAATPATATTAAAATAAAAAAAAAARHSCYPRRSCRRRHRRPRHLPFRLPTGSALRRLRPRTVSHTAADPHDQQEARSRRAHDGAHSAEGYAGVIAAEYSENVKLRRG